MIVLNKIKIIIKKNKIKTFILFLSFIAFIFCLPNNLFNKSYSTVLVDANNQLLCAQIADDGQWRFPVSDSVPVKFKDCILTFEDEYFNFHLGINPVSIIKSIKRNITSGKVESGGSTITMQVARMMRGNNKRNYIQKIIEMIIAFRIECSYSKKSILNIYTSNAPFGSNVVGLSAASWRYFGRDARNLSWAESALLAVLPNAPSLIYPGKNSKLLLQKRNKLLIKLYQKNKISKSDFVLALSEPIPTKTFAIPQHAKHLLDLAIKSNLKSQYVKTTLNLNIQLHANELLNKHINYLKSNHIYNAGLIIADNETGNIIAYIGNSDDKLNEHQNYVDVNQAPRSTGSILKPFLYAFMLNENKILPKSLIEDVPTQIGNYAPKNFNLTYDGLVPANEAIARSLNIPAVKMLQDYSSSKFHFRLKQLGFTTFKKSTKHYGLSLILGGGEATLFEVAGAYSSMARALHGYNNARDRYLPNAYHQLSFINSGKTKKVKPTQTNDLLSAGSIWQTFNAMTELLRPQDYIGWMQFLNKSKIAWKTGTSFGFRDAWAVGLNSKYCVAVWVGNADGEGRPELTGTACAAPLLFATFNILQNRTWFTKPSSCFNKIKVCKQSGYRVNEYCTDFVLQDVLKGYEQSKSCPFHKPIFLDETGLYRVNSDCYEVNKMKKTIYFIANPIQEYFFKQKSLFYKVLPPFLPNCTSENSIQQIGLIYPKEGYKIYVPINETGEKSKCIFKATHKKNNTTLYWHLDGTYLGNTTKYHQIAVLPSVGEHTLVLTDDEGENLSCKFTLLDKVK